MPWGRLAASCSSVASRSKGWIVTISTADPDCDPGTVGRTYELAGPKVYTLHELVKMTLQLMGKRRLLVPIPFAVAEVQARLFELLPNPPLTTGQVDLLKTDNVVSGALPDVQELGIQPKTVEEVIPTYIGPRAPGPR